MPPRIMRPWLLCEPCTCLLSSFGSGAWWRSGPSPRQLFSTCPRHTTARPVAFLRRRLRRNAQAVPRLRVWLSRCAPWRAGHADIPRPPSTGSRDPGGHRGDHVVHQPLRRARRHGADRRAATRDGGQHFHARRSQRLRGSLRQPLRADHDPPPRQSGLRSLADLLGSESPHRVRHPSATPR